ACRPRAGDPKRTGRRGRPGLPCSRRPRQRRGACRRRGSERALEVAHLLFGALAAPAVLLLQLAGQVFAVALGNVEHVVSEITPPRLGLAFHLRPLARNDVLVHACLPLRLWGGTARMFRTPAMCAAGSESAVKIAFVGVDDDEQSAHPRLLPPQTKEAGWRRLPRVR